MKLKRTFNKLLAMILILAMLMPATAFAHGSSGSVGSDSDVKGHWAEGQFAAWQQKGLILGYGSGVFKPNQAITRAEFVTLINNVFQFTAWKEIAFADISSGNPYYSEFEKAVSAGYLNGYEDGTVRPAALITRQEAAVVLAKAFELKQTVPGTVQLQDAGEIPGCPAE